MAQQIGAKIGVEGDAEFKRSLGNLASEAKALKAEMTALKTSTSDAGSEQERAEQIAKNYAEQIRVQEERIRLLNDQLSAAKTKYGENSTEVNNLRTKLANAQTALNELKVDQEQATGATEDFTAAEEDAGNAAVTTGDLIKANLISDAIVAGLKKLAELAAEAAKALYDCAVEAAGYADEFLTMASTTGVSTDTLQQWAYMADLVDVSLDTMTGSLTKVTKSMASARAGGKTASAAFDRLGIRVTNADGTLRSAESVFYEAIDALGQIENETERDALAMEIFGKSARELNPLIEAGTKKIAGWAKEAEDMGYVLDEETLARLGQLDDAFVRFGNLRTSIRNRLGAAMAPALERVLTKLTEFAERVDWDLVGEKLGAALETGADKLIGFLDGIDIDQLASAVTSIAEGIISAVSFLIEHADEIMRLIGTIGAGLLIGKGVNAGRNAVGWVSGLFGSGGAAAATGGGGAAASSGTAAAATAGGGAASSMGLLGPLGLMFGSAILGGVQGANYFDNLQNQYVVDTEASIDQIVADMETIDAQIKKLEADAENAKIYGTYDTTADDQLRALREDYAELDALLQQKREELAGEGQTSGEDFVASMADGITAGANKWLVPALTGVALAAKAILGHSEPTEGPMADDSSWMPDFMQSMASGITDNAYLVRDAMAGLAYDLSDTMGRVRGGDSISYGGVTVVFQVQPGQDGRALFEEFSSYLASGITREGAVYA